MAKQWKTFEYAILRSFENMVDEYSDLRGAGFRRRQAFGGQGFDVLFESNLGRFVVECKTKVLTDEPTGREKFYVGQAIREEQLTGLLEFAVGMAAVPVFAFGIFGPGKDRQAWLVHAEDVTRLLLRSRGITVQEVAEFGMRLRKIRVGTPKRSIYQVDPGQLKVLAADYREKVERLRMSAIYEWTKEHEAEGVNLQRALKRGKVWV